MPQQSQPTSRPPWRALVITLLPDCFPGPLSVSLAGQALHAGLWSLDTIAVRDFGIGKHASVDDTPAGGGPGMVLRADVIDPAIEAATIQNKDAPLIYLSPRGNRFTQAMARSWIEGPGVTLLAGRFEGVDQRVLDARDVTEISIGDYILSGGEIAALTVLDACVRLLPGVLGAAQSLHEESFENGLLEYPQYTRPRQWQDRDIPEVLLSGDHQRIKDWRLEQSLKITKARRPDLLEKRKSES